MSTINSLHPGQPLEAATNLSDKINENLNRILDKSKELTEQANNLLSSSSEKGDRICSLLTDFTTTVINSTSEALLNEDEKVPEFNLPKNTLVLKNLRPTIRYDVDLSKVLTDTVDDAVRTSSLFEVLGQNFDSVVTLFKEYIKYIDTAELRMSMLSRNFSNFFATINPIAKTLKSIVPNEIFARPNLGLTCLRSLLHLRTVSQKDYAANIDKILNPPNKQQVAMPAELLAFWQKIGSPSAAQALLSQNFLIESLTSSEKVLRMYFTFLGQFIKHERWLNGVENAVTELITDDDIFTELKTALDRPLLDLKFVTLEDPLFEESNDMFGLEELLSNSSGKGGYANLDTLFETYKYYNDSFGLGAEESMQQTLIELDPRGGSDKKRKRTADSSSAKKSDIQDTTVFQRLKKLSTTLRTKQANLRSSEDSLFFRTKVYENVLNETFLNNLISPFGEVVRTNISLVPADFSFNWDSMGYSFFDNLDDDKALFINFLNSLTDFTSLWVYIQNLFEPRSLKTYNELLDLFFEDTCKSLFVASVCLEADGETSLLKEMRQNKDQLFPMTVSFREISIVSQYLATKHSNPEYSMSSLSIDCVYDIFLLQPHIQILMLYSYGYIFKYFESRLTNSVVASIDDEKDIYSCVLKNLNPDLGGSLAGDKAIILTQLVLIKILDLIYQAMDITPLHDKEGANFTPPLDSKLTDSIKTFGYYVVNSLEEYEQYLGDFISAGRIFESSVPVSLHNTEKLESNLLLCSKVQLRNMAAICRNEITFSYFIQNQQPVFQSLNKTMALFIFLANKAIFKQNEATLLGTEVEKTEEEEAAEAANLLQQYFGSGCPCKPKAKGGYNTSCESTLKHYSSLNSLIFDFLGIGKRQESEYWRVYPIKNEQLFFSQFTSARPISHLDISDRIYWGKHEDVFPYTEEMHGDVLYQPNANLYYLSIDSLYPVPECLDSELKDLNMLKMADEQSSFYMSMPQSKSKLVRYKGILYKLASATPLHTILEFIAHFNEQFQNKWFCRQETSAPPVGFSVFLPANLTMPTADTKHFVVYSTPNNETPRGEIDSIDVLFSFNIQTDYIYIPNCQQRGFGPKKRKIAEVEKEEIKAPDCPNLVYNIPTAADFITKYKKDSMGNMDFYTVDIDRILAEFQSLEPFKNLIETFKIMEDNKTKLNLSNPNMTNLHKNYILIQHLLPEMVMRHHNHAYTQSCLLTKMKNHVFFAVLAKLALQHFYKNPRMYLFDEMPPEYRYLDTFMEAVSGYFYINMPKYVRFLKTHEQEFLKETAPVLIQYYYLFTNSVDLSKPYLFVFQSFHLTRSSINIFYVGLIMIFFAHLINGKIDSPVVAPVVAAPSTPRP